jgi:hypothetical protein
MTAWFQIITKGFANVAYPAIQPLHTEEDYLVRERNADERSE